MSFYTRDGELPIPNAWGWGSQLDASPSRLSAANPDAGPAPPPSLFSGLASELGVGGGRCRRTSAPDRPALLTLAGPVSETPLSRPACHGNGRGKTAGSFVEKEAYVSRSLDDQRHEISDATQIGSRRIVLPSHKRHNNSVN